MAREWFRQRHHSVKGIFRKKNIQETSLNAHIATEWTEGRLRLDSILTLIKSLADLLEKEVKALRRLDHSDPRYEGEVRQMVGPTLRHFTFDKHLSRRVPRADSAPEILRPGSSAIEGSGHETKIVRPRRDPICHRVGRPPLTLEGREGLPGAG
jgi:hypothetical protein